MAVTIDKFEYATDIAARGVWKSTVVLYMNFNQSDAVFTDMMGNTLVNNGVTYDAGGVFNGCGYAGGANNYIQAAVTNDFDFGTEPFSIECRVKPVTQVSDYPDFISNIRSNFTSPAMSLRWKNDYFGFYAAGMGDPVIKTASNYPSGSFYAVQFSRSGSNIYLLVNGEVAASGSIGSSALNWGGTNALTIGKNGWDGGNGYFKGYIDELIISKGVARNTSAYTVATAEESSLFFYTESTIKKSGDYSMKLVAEEDTSLNMTATRTVSPTINLTDQTSLKIWVRASRTGTNFKLGLHDSGGTTTESNIAISSADTWEEKTIDISSVSNANKDAINSLILTITNADAENTIYLDDWLGYSLDEGTGGGGGGLPILGGSIVR